MTLFDFVPEKYKERILHDAYRFGIPESKKTLQKVYDFLIDDFNDSLIDVLHFSTNIPISQKTQNIRKKKIHDNFPSQLKDSLLNSINNYKEPDFFTGAIKCIEQDGNYFIIHRQNRRIYQLTENKIVPIIQLERAKRGSLKNFFLDDRDNKRLIVFTSIKWLNKNISKINIETIDENEANRVFKKLAVFNSVLKNED